MITNYATDKTLTTNHFKLVSRASLTLATLCFSLTYPAQAQLNKAKGTKPNQSPQTKASTGDGSIVTASCSYSAKPQGFVLSVYSKEYPDHSTTTFAEVSPTRPAIFSTSTQGLPIGSPNNWYNLGTPFAQFLGKQTSAPYKGVAPGGGYARNTSGQLITGNVYHLIGGSVGTPYSGPGAGISENRGFADMLSNASCSASNLNGAITKINQQRGTNIPHINATSTAYNNRGPLSATNYGNSGSVMGNWAGDLYNRYYAMAGDPGWHYSMVDYSEFLADNVELVANSLNSIRFGFTSQQHAFRNAFILLASGHPSLADANLSAAAAYKIINPHNIEFKLLEGSNLTLDLVEVDDDDADLQLRPRTPLPPGFMDQFYPKPNPINGAGQTVVASTYPGNLYVAPKPALYYQGYTGGGMMGSAGKKTHKPLPNICNPSHADYVTPAFLNQFITEELRQDWRYLTDKNVQALRAKGYEKLYEDSLNDFSLNCQNGVNGIVNCLDMVLVNNPSLPRKTYQKLNPAYANATMPSPLPTSPVSGPAFGKGSGKGLFKQRGNKKDNGIISQHIKYVKTEAYYQNLINNKLHVMNLNYSAKSCHPAPLGHSGLQKKR